MRWVEEGLQISCLYYKPSQLSHNRFPIVCTGGCWLGHIIQITTLKKMKEIFIIVEHPYPHIEGSVLNQWNTNSVMNLFVANSVVGGYINVSQVVKISSKLINGPPPNNLLLHHPPTHITHIYIFTNNLVSFYLFQKLQDFSFIMSPPPKQIYLTPNCFQYTTWLPHLFKIKFHTCFQRNDIANKLVKSGCL